MEVEEKGFQTVQGGVCCQDMDALRSSLFVSERAGIRCLLDESVVRRTVAQIREKLSMSGLLPEHAVAIQAIAFEKTTNSNWKVTWHQDVMFPFGEPVKTPGFDQPSKKDGIDYARPPRLVLENMTAVRLHLDHCDDSNGPLRVAPYSHRSGIVRSADIAQCLARFGEVTCLAKEGEMLVMKPLLLHSSSRAKNAKHRRVLHLVFYSGAPISETWHRST